MTAPVPSGFYEVVLEVKDLAVSERFYCDGLGLTVANRWSHDRPGLFLSVGREGFLGLWPAESGGANAIAQGRGGAHLHFALRLPTGSLPAMRAHLATQRIAIVAERAFEQGNLAIYIRDPDDHLIELTEIVELWDGASATDVD